MNGARQMDDGQPDVAHEETSAMVEAAKDVYFRHAKVNGAHAIILVMVQRPSGDWSAQSFAKGLDERGLMVLVQNWVTLRYHRLFGN